ncbi:ABC-type glycerol-3-phosphate transport system, substrate-binding protein [Actinacidiphila alni]|uniref:ABC-type glycerol-3-phosphate transport system, substrate-binding protein n=1 Tax=Actinacidiphila alni TaxID=380248 RepID=A0A1I2L9J4_9ACTN|nr:extracellular solute-binding protein [Actinacidiphila alni]SFF75653.1 ABC-type glycerol-3-phosphate transport system, substrate-binding protein [Actinacidiphila alni]
MSATDPSRTLLTRRGLLRSAAVLGGAATLGGALSACSSSSGSGGGTTLTHWDFYDSQEPWVKNELALFGKAHPEIHVRRTKNAQAGYDNLFNLAERSGRTPDTFFLTKQTVPINQQVQKGWLLPLDKYATAEWVRTFPAYSFVEGLNVFDGKIYSAPFVGSGPPNQLFVNNKVFRDAGLTNADGSVQVPRTWDDMSRAADAIVRRSGGRTYGLGFGNGSTNLFAWWFDVLIRGAGSPGGSTGLDLRVGKYTYGTDRNYADLTNLIMEWKKKDYFYPNSLSVSDEIARAYFERGKFGMTVGGVWNEAEWTAHGFTDYSVTTLVGPDETHKAYFYRTPGSALMGINARTKHPDAAWQWFSWWHSKAAAVRWVQKYREDLSAHPEANASDAIRFKPFAEYVALQDLSLPGPQPWIRNPAASGVVVAPVQPDLGAFVAGVYSGQIKDISGALTSLGERSQSALDAGIKDGQKRGLKISAADWVFADWDPTKPYKWDIPEYPK